MAENSGRNKKSALVSTPKSFSDNNCINNNEEILQNDSSISDSNYQKNDPLIICTPTEFDEHGDIDIWKSENYQTILVNDDNLDESLETIKKYNGPRYLSSNYSIKNLETEMQEFQSSKIPFEKSLNVVKLALRLFFEGIEYKVVCADYEDFLENYYNETGDLKSLIIQPVKPIYFLVMALSYYPEQFQSFLIFARKSLGLFKMQDYLERLELIPINGVSRKLLKAFIEETETQIKETPIEDIKIKSDLKFNPWDYLQTANEVEIKPTKWLAYPVIERGSVTVICGQPGSGKSFLTVLLGAFITGKQKFPFDSGKSTQGTGECIFFNKEDTAGGEIIKRLNRFDFADKSKFSIPKAKETGGIRVGYHFPESVDDPILKNYIDDDMKPDLIVIDPLYSFLGDRDSNKATVVSNALETLTGYVADTDTAVLLIHHDSKDSNVTNAIDRVSGSRAIVSVPRSVWTWGEHPDIKNHFILAPTKSNRAQINESLEFEFIDTENEDVNKPPYLKFYGFSDITDTELYGGTRKQRTAPKADTVKSVVNHELRENGQLTLKELINRVDEFTASNNLESISKQTIRNTVSQMDLETEKAEGFTSEKLYSLK